MALQESGPISMSEIRQELGIFDGAFSLNAAELGQFSPINQFSTVKPDGSNPNSMSEWYRYDHNTPDPGGLILIPDPDPDPDDPRP